MGTVFQSLDDVDLSGDVFTSPPAVGPSTVLHGVLANGMRYYVRPCSKPKERTAIGVAVRVGSVVETEAERGVAHILEHLAFNATETYSNHDIVKFLEGIGASFGACQNAYTSQDETVYQLVVPSTQRDTLQQALTVVSEMVFKIRCAAEDLAKERGAVLEEWRQGRTTQGRTAEAHYQLILQGSRYAERLPIGTEAVIRGVSADTVRAFHHRWYRPENMAVIVVGDFPAPLTTGDVAGMLASTFEGATTAPRFAEPPQPVPRWGWAAHDTPRYRVFVDREAADSSVYASFKGDRQAAVTPADYLEQLKDQLFQIILSNRLFRLSRAPDPPFFAAGAAREALCAAADSAVLSAVAMEGQTLRALEVLLTEAARIRCHGVSEAEFQRALRELQSDVEATYLERDQGYCSDYRDEYVRHFLSGEFVTGQEYEARLCKTLLPRISRSDVEAQAQQYHPHNSAVFKSVEHRRHHSEGDMRAVVQRVLDAEAAGTIPPWSQSDAPEELMASEPEPGGVVSERWLETLQAWEMELANGMRVTVRQTDFFDDEVMITAVASGGLSQVPRPSFDNASMSTVISRQLGAFGHKPELLNDILAGKRVEVDYSLGAYNRQVKGSASPADMREALQLVHLLFTHKVEVEEGEIAQVMRVAAQGIEAQLRNPMHAYGVRVRAIKYSDCYYFEPMTLARLDKVDPLAATSHHNSAFSDPSHFSVVLTGNLSKAKAIPLVERYLASIPRPPEGTAPPKLSPVDITPLPVAFPETTVVEEVPMVSPLTSSQITFPATIADRARAREEVVWLNLGCRLLETRLLQVMRFRHGKVYGVSVMASFGCAAPSGTGPLLGEVSISFTCDPAAREALIARALEEVCLVQEAAAEEEEVATIGRNEQLAWEEEQAENGFWHDAIVSGYQSRSFAELGDVDQVHLRTLAARDAVMAALGPETLRSAMRRLLPCPASARYTAVTCVPQQPRLLGRLAFRLTSDPVARAYAVAGAMVVVAVVATAAVALHRTRRR